jgi:ATP-binding cassette subfamily F protein 3
MIQLQSISKSFGARSLFSDVQWRLNPGRRIGLIGANGAGKTTLFRIISREMEPDSGQITMPPDATIGLLPQEVGDLEDLPVLDFVLKGRQDLLDLESRIAVLSEQLEHTTDEIVSGTLAGELAECTETFRQNGGYTLVPRAEEILRGMGFVGTLREKTARQLSGGWKIRLVLARLLLQRPSLLLMDEPTNHLDVPSIEWLEGFLGNYEGTVIIISHDRYFLNRLVNEIAALELDGLQLHNGGYDDYMRARAERIEMLQKQREGQDRHIKAQTEFIDRFRSKASKARQVQSRVKQLEKIELVELPDERKSLRGFRFPEAPASGRDVITVKNAAKSFGDNVVYKSLGLVVERGERVALVGPNGAGKTTLLRMIAGRLPPDAGSVALGHNVIASYFGQHQVDELDDRRTVIEEMESAATVDTAHLCRSILGAFLFSGDDVTKKIRVLSGGERNRVALAKMLLTRSNLLLLDEPTNHLDMSSRDTLMEALQMYKGTLVLVSHDRHFINGVATRVVHVENTMAVSYGGDYEYYSYKRRSELEAGRAPIEVKAPASGVRAPSGVAPVPQAAAESDSGRKERKRREAQFRQELASRTRRTRRELEKAESDVNEKETRLATIAATLADPTTWQDGTKVDTASLQREQRKLQEDLAWLMDSWTDLAAALEKTENELRVEFDITERD